MFGSPETTTGGRALKFPLVGASTSAASAPSRTATSWWRPHARQDRQEQDGAPFREAEFDIMYGEGVSRAGDLVDIASNARSSTRAAPGSPTAASGAG
jgi:recombination protein RecA